MRQAITIIAIILIFIIITSSVYASNVVTTPYMNFEAGTNIEYECNVGYIDMLIGYRIKYKLFKWEMYGEMKNFHVWGSSVFDQGPFRIIYTAGTKVYFGNWYLKVEHFCSHPVYSPQHVQAEYYNHAAYWYVNKGLKAQQTLAAIGYSWN